MAIKVICFGTFDILHEGHLNYFQQAKEFGDYLIVVIARDKTKEKQNKHLVHSEEERLAEVKKQEIVDEAVLGDLNDYFKVIREKNPKVICLGYDQEADENKLKEAFPDIEIKRLKPYQEDKYKSSLLRK